MKNYMIGILIGLNIVILAAVIWVWSLNVEKEEESLQLVDTIKLSAMIKSQENMVIVDLREPDLYTSGKVPGSINIPFEQIENRYLELPKNKKIVFVCHTGRMGTESGNLLLSNGYSQVYNLDGGMAKWSGELENDRPESSSLEKKKQEITPQNQSNPEKEYGSLTEKIGEAQLVSEPDSISVPVNKK
ncbi:rhodanese-like domain-containing protein [Cohnella phaseoli]|uniref:Rhodanese-related sulfurtransferase n=1 Tax=Cohnella phaseoli TaxID=456490 RepID=A0A3D9JRJ9_9BACL|nr:rhodanese-related sulfurtransferase [Cohnella phaseoli]